MHQRILIVDDDSGIRRLFSRYLERSGYEVESVESAERALGVLAEFAPDLVLTDVRMAGMSGLELVEELHARARDLDVIVVTGYEDMQTAIDAIRGGAYDYLAKPVDLDQLGLVVARCFRDRAAAGLGEAPPAAAAARPHEPERPEIIGRHPRMVEVYKLIGAVAGTRTPVLIRGETGTGKELVARAIHANSPRAAEPFLAVNCTALPENLLESELFGHVRGAFTGALQARKGFFELADSGTIFLDEIGDVAPAFQAKLLRVLQEGEFFPVGAEQPRRTRARVIAATNRPLERLVRDGAFREDLYFRLRVVEIRIPPLRERRSDIPLLAKHLLARIGRAQGRSLHFLSDDVLDLLSGYDWPGNIRELENVLARAAVLARGEAVSREEIELGPAADSDDLGPEPADPSLDAAIAAHVARVLRQTDGNKRRAARLLGISRSRLDRLIEKHDLAVSE